LELNNKPEQESVKSRHKAEHCPNVLEFPLLQNDGELLLEHVASHQRR
jgi:hypothetical protein